MTPQAAIAGAARSGRRRDAEENRDRILRAARTLLAAEPNASMDDLAQAAGVVRRTVYAHFPNRDALLTGLGDKVAADVSAALSAVDRSQLSPAVALADFDLALWRAGDQYRLLIALADREAATINLSDLLTPIREQAVALLERGRDEGSFAVHLPIPVLAAGLQNLKLSLIRSVTDGIWTDDGTQAVTAMLIAAGLPAREAERAVRQARLLLTS